VASGDAALVSNLDKLQNENNDILDEEQKAVEMSEISKNHDDGNELIHDGIVLSSSEVNEDTVKVAVNNDEGEDAIMA